MSVRSAISHSESGSRPARSALAAAILSALPTGSPTTLEGLPCVRSETAGEASDCGRPTGIAAADTSAIRTGDNSVVKAVVNRARMPVLERSPQAVPVIPALPVQPLIATGNESVLKAEIDASSTVSAAGDVVSHKEVHSTHHETHIHGTGNATAGRRTALTRSWRRRYSARSCNRRASQTEPSSRLSLSKSLRSNHYRLPSQINRRLTQARYVAGMHALEIIKQRNAKQPDVLARVGRMGEKLSAAGAAAKWLELYNLGLGLAALLVIGVFFLIWHFL